MYPEEMVKPMRSELSEVGFQELYSAEAVEDALKSEVSISGNFLKGLLALLMPTDQV